MVKQNPAILIIRQSHDTISIPCLFSLLLLAGLLCIFPACNFNRSKINIVSVNLSHRILPLDTVETRLNLIVGFTISPDMRKQPKNIQVSGVLSHHGTPVATVSIPKLDFYGGDLNFYLPFTLSPGDYDLKIILSDRASANVLMAQNFIIKNIETISCRETKEKKNWMQPQPIALDNPPDEKLSAPPTQVDQQRGFILWHRNPFRYVYPNSAPKQSDIIQKISVRLARNEYEPATFSLYALKNAETVAISLSKLQDKAGNTLAPPDIYTVKTVPRIKNRKTQKKTYEQRPRLLQKNHTSLVPAGKSQRFWLTFHAGQNTAPAIYSGELIIKTNLSRTTIPIQIQVLPFTLQERPDKEYGFMMTYVFQEMTARDLTKKERLKIYENGLRYYRSFKEHGLTTVCPHSSFTLQRMVDGNPDLRDLQAALKAFNEVGFTGPFIYYCGHLVHNAKPGWAGSTLSFDSKHHPTLMKEIVTYTKNHFPEMRHTDFYWMPGDEVQDDGGGPDRMKITGKLLQAIQETGEKTALTVWQKTPWETNIQLGGPRPTTGEHWQYPNELTTVPDSVDDAISLRRAFGISHVKSNYIGILPWTFQTSENAAGDPYSDLDNNGRAEVMIAYPGIDGPVTTPEYEAVREGIDDGRYAYLLETEIKQARQSASKTQRNLGRRAETEFAKISAHAENATIETMDANRRTMTYWILQLASPPGFNEDAAHEN